MQEIKMGKIEPIVNYFFKSPDAVFDRHRYDKGGKVLHMLRRYLGDDAFFASLQHFLTTKGFQSAEIHDLRLSFEAVTGEDLNWFFNQWWLSAGHPIVNINHAYNAEKKQVNVEVVQTQMSNQLAEVPVFKIPLDIDLIFEDTTVRHSVWLLSDKSTFDFDVATLPLAVNVDPGKLTLWERKDQISTAELLTIFNKSDKILDKVYVFEQLKNRQKEPEVKAFMLQLLKHDYWYLRKATIAAAELSAYKELPVIKSTISELALTDPKPSIRREALTKMESDQKSVARQLALQLIDTDSSLQVLSKALEIIKDSSVSLAYNFAKRFDTFENQYITMAVANVYADSALPEHIKFFERALYLQWASSFMTLNEAFFKYLSKTDVSVFERGLIVLSNIIQNEETGRHIRAAKRTLKRLNELKISEKPGDKDALTRAKKDILEKYLSLVN
jgi:aminopeptidase N